MLSNLQYGATAAAGYLHGVRIVVTADQISPRMQLSEGCPVTTEFREEMNVWMREFFGCHCFNALEDGQCMHLEGEGVIYMNPRTYSAMKASFTDQGDAE